MWVAFDTLAASVVATMVLCRIVRDDATTVASDLRAGVVAAAALRRLGQGMGVQEQAAGIEQINRAVEQMNHVTQSNAASSEEAAAASEALSAQATELNDLVEQLVRVIRGGQQA